MIATFLESFSMFEGNIEFGAGLLSVSFDRLQLRLILSDLLFVRKLQAELDENQQTIVDYCSIQRPIGSHCSTRYPVVQKKLPLCHA